mgnify:CR=1 FL=1
MVYQYTKEGAFIAEYKSINGASKATGIERANISRCISGKRNYAGGYTWSRIDSEDQSNDNITTNFSSYQEMVKSAGYELDEVQSTKIWQTSKGEVRFSIVTKDSKEDDSDNLKEQKDLLLKELSENAPCLAKVSYTTNKNIPPCAIEISLPDHHFGKLAHAEETGEDYNLEIAAKLYLETIKELYQKVVGNNIERFVLPIGNDLLNSDNHKQTTTRGTQMHDSHRGPVVFRKVIASIVEAITFLRSKAPVDIIMVPGNHDFESTFSVGEVLSAWYRNDSNVNIDNGLSSYKYYKYGKNLVGFDHGDKIKGPVLATKILKDNKNILADVEFFEWHLGHVHKEMLNEYNGVKVRNLPSLCPADAWHKFYGYDHLRCAQAHIWNRQLGYEGYVQVNK